MKFDKPDVTPEEIEERIASIPEPPVTGKEWHEMTVEEQEIMRDYYDNTDFSPLMENGEWIVPSIERGLKDVEEGRVRELPNITLWPDEPEQLELDLGVVSEWDETKEYSVGQISFYFDRVLADDQWVSMVYAIDEAVTHKGWPEFILSAIMKSGTDRALFPEAYDEGEESNRSEKEEM